jgi:transcription elongation factor Elf1
MNLEFWTKLRDYCERRMGEKYAHSRKCPKCNRWTHAVGGAKTGDIDANHQWMICNQCGQESYWMLMGTVAVSVIAVPQGVKPGLESGKDI